MTTVAAPAPLPFSAGFVLARRYRLVERVGRARLGDVWRADDLVLMMPVALKVSQPADDLARDEVLQSYRLARQITHPAVRRVFDVGQADGYVFCTMEFVPGEDLGTLLLRSGRLPSEKVIAIGRQLCEGLQAAHAQGLVHGDLRPPNILIDDAGAVRITDFESRTHAGLEPSEYMPPEQRGPERLASERGDLYALGVILYELLVGERPKPAEKGRTAIVKPSALVADVDPRLESTVMRALRADPRHRPGSAADMAFSLAATRSHPLPRTAWLAAAGLAVIAASLLAITRPLLKWRGNTLTARDTIVLADVANTTGERVFDGTLKVALAVALEQSPFLRIYPDVQVRDTMRLMQRAPDEPVTRAIAREIARRERLKALVAGSIGVLGNRYILALEVINAESGDVMALEQVEVDSREQVLSALGAATKTLRERLGESLASVQRFDVPLPRATTSSLEALHAYALALDEGRVLPRVEAIPHLKRAIELDPDFAMAHAQLSGVYANTGQFGEAPAFARRAFELRDRVSERERFFISWRYYLDAEQAWDEALALARSWTTTYPREAFAFNSLGLALAAFGDHAQAVNAFREANRLDFRFVPPHGNLIGSLIALDRFADARTLLRQARERRLTFVTERRMWYTLALVAGDRAAMARELDLVRGTPDEMWGSIWEARAEASSGRVTRAHELFQRGAAAARLRDLPALAAQWTMEDAEAQAIVGKCDGAVNEVERALQLSRDNFTLERGSRVLALCGRSASRLTAELARAFPQATLTSRIQLPVTAAAAQLREGNARRALELLEPVKAYDRAPSAEFWPLHLRGQAYLAIGDAAGAASQFEEILSHRGQAPSSALYPLAHLGAARAAALAGNRAAARASYQALLSAWSGADPGLEPLARARAEYERLR